MGTDQRPRTVGQRGSIRQWRSFFFGSGVDGGTKNWETGGAVWGAVFVAGKVGKWCAWGTLVSERIFPGADDGALVISWH